MSMGKNLIELKEFIKDKKIKICLNNNSNIIIMYNDFLLSVRNLSLSRNILKYNIELLKYFHYIYKKTIRIYEIFIRYFKKIFSFNILKIIL